MTVSAADPIYTHLRSQIVSGAFAAGAPLRQDDIAKQFGVSKIPVREALRRLEVENLVVFERNKGAVVRGFSEAEILDLLDIRIALECRALELAIPNMIDSDFYSMHTLLKEYAAQTEVAEWSNMNRRFHAMLYEPCGNPQLLNMITDLQEKLGQYLRVLVSAASGLDRPMREHTNILTACEHGNTEKAVKLLRQHIEVTQKEVAAFLRRNPAAS